MARAYPDYIPYFSEFIPDRKLACRMPSDSNVAWGQAGGRLQVGLE